MYTSGVTELEQVLAETFAVAWQGGLMGLLLLGALGGLTWAWYRTRWETKDPRWQEAVRDWWHPRMQIERWIRFRWIHPDSLYWIAHVDFSKGPLVLEGPVNDALYWSFTYYTGTEVNPSVSSRTVTLPPGSDTFRITLSRQPPADGDWIEVRPDAGKGVVYLRIYEPRHLYPSRLPRISRDGQVLVERVDA